MPNNDNLEGATGTIVLTEGGQGSGGGGDAGNGIKSITISPAITTRPALESFFPIYLENLTEEEKQNGVVINVASTEEPSPGDYTLTVEPTGNWYAGIMGWDGDQQHVSENAGESVTASTSPAPRTQFTVAGLRTPTPSGEDDVVFVNINLDNE